LRDTLITTFYDTLDYCFDTVLGDMLGRQVKDTIFGLLERNGIPRKDVSNRFDESVEVMIKTLGTCSRVIVMRTITEMCTQYSQRMEFSYQDSLRERLTLLRESVVSNHLLPKRLRNYSVDDLESRTTLDITGRSDRQVPVARTQSRKA
jgi:hypothetical protein